MFGSFGEKTIGIIPLEAILHRFGARAHGIVRPDGHVAKLAGTVIVAREQAVIGARVDDLGILGIGRQPAAFAAADVVPIALADAAVVAARG